eukprot:3001_1
MSKKDASGFTPQERHQIIVDYLKSINKPTKVFHLRWKPGELLTGEVLETTPMFWYMKYQWGRAEIEEMFYKARCVIGPLFDMALQQTYGGSAGARWRGAVPQKEKSKWRQRQAEKVAQWQAEEAEKLKQQEEAEKQRMADQQKLLADEQKRRAEEERLRKEAQKTLAYKSKDIWNACSDFGADKSIGYKAFSDNLKDRGINVSPLLAKQLFDSLAGREAALTKPQMDDLIKKLDQMNESLNIKWTDLGDTLGAQVIMKRILLAAGTGTPFNVDDFVFAQKFGVSISPVQYMNKLSDRDVNWDDRVRAMEQLGANLGNNPLFNNVLAKGNIPDLLCGWATQILDNKPEVQKTAIETIPDVFHNAMEFGDKDIAVGYLEEVLDNLYKVLDDPNARKNHPAAKKAINALVDDVVKNGDPESVLVVSHILAEKCDIENANNPESRENALNNLQKIMFGDPSPIVRKLQDKTSKDPPTNIFNNLPPPGSVNREWLDIGTNKIPGPSKNYLEKREAPERYTDTERSGLKPKDYEPQNLQPEFEKKYDSGIGPDEKMQFVPTDPAGPYAHVKSDPSNARVKQPVNFDASKSHDCDNEPCKTFKWDFGDGSPNVTTKGPYTTHPYQHAGVYPVTVTVTDKYGFTAPATCTQRVFEPRGPNQIGPPAAFLTGRPPTTKVNELATFDASKSHDFQNKPCENFVFDFGDGTKPVHSSKPVVKHPYELRGTYPVTVVVTDKYGQKATASLNHRVIDPELPDPLGPTAHVTSNPSEAKVMQPVTFDASKSKDFEGDPCKSFLWTFGDNTKPVRTSVPEVVHPYAKPGSYPVTVEVVDKYGKTAQAGLTQRVVDPKNPSGPPYAHLNNLPPVSDVDEPVTFDASKSHDFKGDPCTKFVWDFGDKSPKKTTNTPITQHPYAMPGSYPVKVIAYDKLGQPAEAMVNQRVRTPPQPEPGIEPPYVTATSTPSNARPKQKVKFDASKSQDFEGDPLKTFEWDFGDGTPLVTTKTPITHHAYDETGTYPVKVKGIDKYDQPGHAKLSQLVTDPKNPNQPLPPYAHIVSDPPISDPKQVVQFDASKSHDQFNKPCVSFLWDFGDGSAKVTTPTPYTKHPYENPGAYPVTVVATDKNGLSAQAGLTQRVRVIPDITDPYVALRSTPSKAKVKEPVRFDSSESVDMDGDPCKTFVWDFGDGTPTTTTTTPIVNHCYDNPGTYPVKVTATDKYGRKGQAHLNQPVLDPKNPTKIGPPYAAVRSNPQESMVNQPVQFDASKSHDFEGGPCKSFLWDFGDNSPKVTTAEPYTKHPYKKAGVYPVTVEVTDKHDQKASAGLNQRVRAPQIEDPFVALRNEPPTSRPKQKVKFDASESVDMDGDPCKNYVFSFGDGTAPIESSTPIVYHPYAEPGSYPVTVLATDKYGRKGNASVTQRVIDPSDPKKILPPTAHVISDPPDSRPKQPVTFDASKSQDMHGDPCKKFVWDFGDGSPKKTTNGPITKHPYAKPGVYPVTVQVTDKYAQTADASLQQRCSDPTRYDDDPSGGPRAPKKKNYGGKRGQQPQRSTDPVGKFGTSGKNQKPASFHNVPPEHKEPDMPQDEIGDEFRNVVHDAISKAILDPNPQNKKAATKTAAVFSKLDPHFMDKCDPEAKKRYEWGLKPYRPKNPRPLPPRPEYKPGVKALHPVQLEVNVDVGKPIMPDI